MGENSLIIKHSTGMIHASMTVWVLGHRVKKMHQCVLVHGIFCPGKSVCADKTGNNMK